MAYNLTDKDGKPRRVEGRDVLASPRGGVIKAVDEEKRILHIVGSDESVDRDGDIIKVNGWMLENYLKNPVFLWMHDRWGVPIGASQKVMRKRNPSRLEFLVKFPTEEVFPFADLILELFKEKILNASSVSFMPYEWEDIKREELEELIGEENISPAMWRPKRIKRQELLELSAVSIPANPNALQADADFGKAISSFAISKGKANDPHIAAIIESRTIEETDPATKHKVMASLDFKDAEFEEETKAMVQVPFKYIEPDIVYTREGFEKTDGTPPYHGEYGVKVAELEEYEDIVRKNGVVVENEISKARIDVIYGVIGEERSVPLSYRLPIDQWTEEEAKAFSVKMKGEFEPAAEYKKYSREELQDIMSEGTALIEDIRELDSELADEVERLVKKDLVGVKLPLEREDVISSEIAGIKATLSELTTTVKAISVSRQPQEKTPHVERASTHEVMLFGSSDITKVRKKRRKGVVKQLTTVVSDLSDKLEKLENRR